MVFLAEEVERLPSADKDQILEWIEEGERVFHERSAESLSIDESTALWRRIRDLGHIVALPSLRKHCQNQGWSWP